ncbi:MAG TPA: Rid family detoxifying hydrolase [Steroidobacteraceae bacterium]
MVALLVSTCTIVTPAARAQERAVISSDGAPKAIGPYSQAIKVGNLVFLSGQIALDPTGRTELSSLDAESQTHRAMDNLAAVLSAAGLSLKDVVATTLYLVDLKDFEAVNRAYGSYFPSSPPARSTVQVAGLPRGARIEVAAIASRP